MYIKKICIQNYGPLLNFNLDMPFYTENGYSFPKPLIIVGKNGTGKTIILSHIVNAALVAKQSIYDDCETEKGKVYKIRAPSYINTHSNSFFSYARLDFEKDNYVFEYQLNNKKSEIEKLPGFSKPNEDWDKIQMPDSTELLDTTFNREENARQFIDDGVIKYFPADRNVIPAWRNQENLLKRQEFGSKSQYINISNRNIIARDEFEKNKEWLMELLLDMGLLEIDKKDNQELKILFNNINRILKTIFEKYGSNLHLTMSARNARKFQIENNSELVLPDLSQLSLGEALLFNLFVSIVADADNRRKTSLKLSDMTGIVIIDEIEDHLHNSLIVETLPKLIRLFPKIQFIITSHSPIFLLGMEKEFQNNIEIIELDSQATNGFERKSAEEFSEFKEAFNLYTTTNSFNIVLKRTTKPVLMTEGKTDEIIIQHAWKMLHPEEEIPFDVIGLSDDKGASGADALNNILSKLPSSIPGKKIIGIFDADEKGIKCFGSLKGFSERNNNCKVKDDNLFATCLPVPDSKSYMKGKEEGFEIEDYFPDNFLQDQGKSKTVVNINKDSTGNEEIDDSRPKYQKFSSKQKMNFANSISGLDNETGIFNNFEILFAHLKSIIVNHQSTN